MNMHRKKVLKLKCSMIIYGWLPVEGYWMSQYVCRGRSRKQSREGKDTRLFRKSILYYLKIDETVLKNHV